MLYTKTTKRQRIKTVILFIISVFTLTFIALMSKEPVVESSNEEEIVTSVQKENKEPIYGRCDISEEDIRETLEWYEKQKAKEAKETMKKEASETEKDDKEENDINDVIEASEFGISQSDFELLCKLTFAEASAPRENSNELKAIAATVLNRVEDEKFPNSIPDVIFAENQFSTVSNGNIYWFPVEEQKEVLDFSQVNAETIDAVKSALDGEDPTKVMVTNGSIFFYSDKYISDYERSLRQDIKEKIKFENTVFYR